MGGGQKQLIAEVRAEVTVEIIARKMPFLHIKDGKTGKMNSFS